MKAEIELSKRTDKLVIRVNDNETHDIIATDALVNFEFDKEGRLISIEIYIPEHDYELKKVLTDALSKRAIKIPILKR